MMKLLALFGLTILFNGCSPFQKTETLEKIIYHTSPCFGYCPIYHLELNQNKKIKLSVQQIDKQKNPYNQKNNYSSIEYYNGILPDSIYDDLTNQVTALGTDPSKFPVDVCCDGSIKTILIVFERKRVKFKFMHTSGKLWELGETLRKICSSHAYLKSGKPFKIEGQRDNPFK